MRMDNSEVVYKQVTDVLTQPTVLKGLLDEWPPRQWSPVYLASVLGSKKLKIRIGPTSAKKRSSVLWEKDCIHEDATLSDFCDWLSNKTAKECSWNNSLLKYNRATYWCYVDYKQMALMFENHQDILEAVQWEALGFAGRDGQQSTMWIGSEGAFTPGHYDTYGFNLVAQIYGRKRWHLFPPEQTPLLYPTRIPYEESSVFTPVNITSPDLERYPKLAEATPYVVTLEPGDVLFVPKRWWHFVESLDVSISVNTWVEVSICSDEVNLGYLRVALQEAANNKSQESREGTFRTIIPPANKLNLHGGEAQASEPDTHRSASSIVTDSVNSSLVSAISHGALPPSTTDSQEVKLDDFPVDGRNISQKITKRHKEESTVGEISSKSAKRTCDGDQSSAGKCESRDAVLPHFIVPVTCRGEIYKGSERETQCNFEKDEVTNMPTSSEVKWNCGVEDIREMVVECVTHPDVISLTTALLREKFCDKLKLNE